MSSQLQVSVCRFKYCTYELEHQTAGLQRQLYVYNPYTWCCRPTCTRTTRDLQSEKALINCPCSGPRVRERRTSLPCSITVLWCSFACHPQRTWRKQNLARSQVKVQMVRAEEVVAEPPWDSSSITAGPGLPKVPLWPCLPPTAQAHSFLLLFPSSLAVRMSQLPSTRAMALPTAHSAVRN